ncbi:MAG: ASKHA domain-containing protein [Eubacterium sp.]|nr:ASKHA domain-containing protein [Eubacterium sp.]
MSEEIKITIVTQNEKQNIQSEDKNEKFLNVTHDSSMTIMSTLLKNNLISGSFCGGRGDCGRCRIQFLKGMTVPTPLERSVIEPEELRQGYRLACLAKPKDDCVIKLSFINSPKIDIISEVIDVTENIDCIGQHRKQTENQKSIVTESMEKIQDKFTKSQYNTDDIFSDRETLIAVDLGTTTIAMQLVMVESGQVVDTYCEMNPQRCYGADVLSRIKASCEGSREHLRQMVVEVLERGVSRFKERLSERNAAIRGMCIAGNTTMEHLLQGYDVSSLGASPFTPVEIGLQEYQHPMWDFPVWLTPGISAFVGGDIVAGLYALRMLPDIQAGGLSAKRRNVAWENAKYTNRNMDSQEKGTSVLLIDLGTNGEMAITDGVRMIVTAAAAGPAFEGGAGVGIVGNDMIACTASLLRQGILDETGLLAEPYFAEGVTVGDPAVHLCNKDIRDLQMAKAAVRAGIEILWRKMGASQISRVYLAGGFGYYLDVEAAFRIGLLPAYMRGKVKAAGNTSLAGAFQIGRDLLRRRTDKETLEQSLSHIESVNLAEQEKFEELYVQYMNFLES